MALVFREMHAAGAPDALNEEYFVLENTGKLPFNAAGCSMRVTGGGRKARFVGQLDPGFTLQPSERVRLVTGNPGKKAHGAPPAEGDVRNYHLFLREAVLAAPGCTVHVQLKQGMEVARATYDPAAPGGVAAAAG